MLWNSVYEFFVRHIFGGSLANGETYSAYLGYMLNADSGNEYNIDSAFGYIKINDFFFYDEYNAVNFISFGNYLSLIATIITMVIIVTLCALFIWKIIKLVGGLIR